MNVVTLIVIILAAVALCWAVSRLPPPWRTAGIVVVAVLALIFLLSLLGAIPPVLGQEPTPSDAPAEEVDAPPPELSASPAVAVVPSVVEVEGQSVAVVPAPKGASEAQTEAVAEQAAENLEAVASGEVTLAEATRDPTSGAPDPGGGGLFWILAIVMGSIVRPVTDVVVERMKAVDNRLSAAIHSGTVLALYLGAWAIFASSNPALPQDPTSWLIAGFAAVGVGSASTSLLRTQAPRPKAATS